LSILRQVIFWALAIFVGFLVTGFLGLTPGALIIGGLPAAISVKFLLDWLYKSAVQK
jgi:hypothetical protein